MPSCPALGFEVSRPSEASQDRAHGSTVLVGPMCCIYLDRLLDMYTYVRRHTYIYMNMYTDVRKFTYRIEYIII